MFLKKIENWSYFKKIKNYLIHIFHETFNVLHFYMSKHEKNVK